MTYNKIKDEIDKRISELNLQIHLLDDKIQTAHFERKTKQEDKLLDKRRYLSIERSALCDMLRVSKTFTFKQK